MKANAPEKLYLFENPISGTPDDRWLSKRSDDNDIEYTRTDVFIKKAVAWLDETLRNTDFYENEIELMVKEFKKAMKL